MPISPPQTPPAPSPPSCSECVTTVQPATGLAPVQSPSRMLRSSDGKIRIDTQGMSVISDPKAQQSIVLNHLTKEAQIIPLQPKPPQGAAPGAPPKPGAPAIPGMPQTPGVQVEELGKSVIDGHPVEGKRYTVPTPAPPSAALPGMPAGIQPPGAPGAPGTPAAGMPGVAKPPAAPAAAGLPKPPAGGAPKLPAPAVFEVWISSQFKTPVLTTGTTPSGAQTTKCKPAASPEPDPSLFQIPAGYKKIG